jgi:hypothetical protein
MSFLIRSFPGVWLSQAIIGGTDWSMAGGEYLSLVVA